ncbi:hypothetical protein B0T16DRAFT_211577 [Cercophora newfieldiana]|uniref:Uncharacterized protein n=1 Tax=Cercophora newfieldiana TaxID=92897 RepID=A0AA40CJZ4_9PEZI|nr:hypothetical protein B0T16DRAFT_211577 [Cercophora newfieldiana]
MLSIPLPLATSKSRITWVPSMHTQRNMAQRQTIQTRGNFPNQHYLPTVTSRYVPSHSPNRLHVYGQFRDTQHGEPLSALSLAIPPTHQFPRRRHPVARLNVCGPIGVEKGLPAPNEGAPVITNPSPVSGFLARRWCGVVSGAGWRLAEFLGAPLRNGALTGVRTQLRNLERVSRTVHSPALHPATSAEGRNLETLSLTAGFSCSLSPSIGKSPKSRNDNLQLP